jgi:hypothetical protein
MNNETASKVRVVVLGLVIVAALGFLAFQVFAPEDQGVAATAATQPIAHPNASGSAGIGGTPATSSEQNRQAVEASRQPAHEDEMPAAAPEETASDDHASEPEDDPSSEPPGAHEHGPADGFHDPLGTAVGPDELTEVDKGRAMTAAMRFVLAAYDYDGSDAAEYLAGVERTVIVSEFNASPGAEAVDAYAKNVRRPGGVESYAALKGFEVERVRETDYGDQLVTGIATIQVKDDRGERELTQELTLARTQSAFIVTRAQPLQEMEA